MIKQTLLNLMEFFNFHLVYATYGYMGDMHRAINFAYSSGHLMLAIRPALFYQARRRVITPEQLSFTDKLMEVKK